MYDFSAVGRKNQSSRAEKVVRRARRQPPALLRSTYYFVRLAHQCGHGVPEVGRSHAFSVRNHDGRDMIADMNRPLIGISIDNVLNNIDSGRYESNVNYSLAVAKAGGLPVLLPQEMELVDHYVECLDGLLLTGGDDAHTEHFGDPAHPLSRCIEPGRQKFELALLGNPDGLPTTPGAGGVSGDAVSWRCTPEGG